MNRNLVLGTLGVGLLLILIGIVSRSETHLDRVDSVVPKVVVTEAMASDTEIKLNEVVNASNSFGFKLFKQLSAPDNKNVIISPHSIAIALTMLLNGTGGETLSETTKALELDLLETPAINSSYQKLLETLATDDAEIQVAIANSLWANRDIALNDSFVSQAQEYYQAEVNSLDFKQPQTKDTINQWVASKTADKIPQIIDAVSPQSALYLINAVYFKGDWTTPFDSSKTTQQPFYTQPDVPVQEAMMNQTGEYRYYQNDKFQAVALPYGKKQQLSMYLLLPSQDSSLAEFQAQLTPDNWQEWLSQMRSQPGKISLPRFQLEYEAELKNALASLGMQQIFNPSNADFSPLTNASVAVDAVKHKTLIEVNEKGTEAAATTSIGVRITSVNPQQPFTMNINRPFFFAIGDDVTKTILFMGNVVEPSTADSSSF